MALVMACVRAEEEKAKGSNNVTQPAVSSSLVLESALFPQPDRMLYTNPSDNPILYTSPHIVQPQRLVRLRHFAYRTKCTSMP